MIRKPPVPAAGSCTISPGCGWIQLTMHSINGRGVKYCPAPDFFSPAFFSSNPSYRSPSPSSRAEYQSSESMLSTTLVLCQILIDWYGNRVNPSGGARMWSSAEGELPCQGKGSTK